MMRNPKSDDTILLHIYHNAKRVLLVLTTLAGIWAIYFHIKVSKEVEYNPKTVIEISQVLVNSIQPQNDATNPLASSDSGYQQGWDALKKCKQISLADRITGKQTQQYNKLLVSLNQTNQSIGALKDKGILSERYYIPLNAAIHTGCQYGLDKVQLVLNNYFKSQADFMSMNWAEKNSKKSLQNQVTYVSLPQSWNVTKNPWRGFDGCIYMAANESTKTKISQEKYAPALVMLENGNTEKRNKLCRLKTMYRGAKTAVTIEKEDQQIVPLSAYSRNAHKDFIGIGQLLDGITQVKAENEPYHISMDGVSVAVGFNAQLGIQPRTQIIAQTLANCFSDDQINDPLCTTIPSGQKNTMSTHENGALAREIAIAVIDVRSQQIEALASATSPCFDSAYGVLQKSDCLATPQTWRSMFSANDVLANHAIHSAYMPGSSIKPIQALAIVRAFPQAVTSKNNQDRLRSMMAKSSTESVIDVLACQDISTAYAASCQGFAHMQQAANDLGWNAVCDSEHDATNCGSQDILRGLPPYRSVYQNLIFYGRLMQRMDTGSKTYLPMTGLGNIPANAYREHKNKNSGWTIKEGTKNNNEAVSTAVNEAYGQGEARATALGVANMLTILLARADSQPTTSAHLLQRVWHVDQADVNFSEKRPEAEMADDDKQQPFSLKAFFGQLAGGKKAPSTATTDNSAGAGTTSAITAQDAALAVSFFTAGHTIGTARIPCQEVFGHCDEYVLGYKLFSKTGTPTFNKKFTTIQSLTNACKGTRQDPDTCRQRPVKWFSLGIGEKNGQWSKVIVIMAERNWTKSGIIDDIGDGNNVAARMAFTLMKALDNEKLLTPREVKNDNPL